MLSPSGNPSTENFFDIVSALQKMTRVKLSVNAKAAQRAAVERAACSDMPRD